MTDRDRLIELFFKVTEEKDCPQPHEIADYLLANGVIVPPCKVGDYVLWNNGIEVQMKEVKGIYYDSTNLGMRYILEDFQPIINHSAIKGVLTKEQAEEKLKELNSNER